MKRSWCSSLSALLCVPAIFLAVSHGRAAELARPAEDFVESLGVNVHAQHLYDTLHEALAQKLGEAGIRHVRDGAHDKAFAHATSFFEKHGIRTTFITGRRIGGRTEWKSPLDVTKVEAELRGIREKALAATAAIEGPNEYDLFHDERDKQWAETLREYQRRVFAGVKADPALRHLPVIGPSLTSEAAYSEAGDLGAFLDFTCLHLYQSTRHPGTAGWGPGGYGSIAWNLRHAAVQNGAAAPARPVQVTECGYVSSVKVGGVPEEVEGKYLPRMYAEFFRRGIARSFKYELMDGDSKDAGDAQKHYGLLRSDLGEKPAFVALKSLIGLLADSKWDAEAKKRVTPAFAPASLAFSLAGATNQVRHLLLQKSDGTFHLLLWQEVESYEPPNNGHPEISPRYERNALVALHVDAADATVFTQQPDGTLRESAAAVRDGALEISVPDRMVIVRLVKK